MSNSSNVQPSLPAIEYASSSQGGASSESDFDDASLATSGGERSTANDDKMPSIRFDAIDFDSFAMQSLQTTASAILAAQRQQEHDDSFQGRDTAGSIAHSVTSGSENEAGFSRQQSPSSTSAALQRRGSQAKGAQATTQSSDKGHVERHKWTAEETQTLVRGCNKHGIGNWKAILSDEEFAQDFVGRTPGDLKDRFRTYFPDAYHEMYPNAKTHTSRVVRSKAPDGTSIFEKGKTKERRPFTAAEDNVLKRGYQMFGSHWAVIAKDPVFEGKRKSTDLRDRFRNAFPGLYEQAGYKPRAKAAKKERRQSSSGSFSQPERPALISRSETSTSAHSQAVSEHSDEEASEFLSWTSGHLKQRSDDNFPSGDASLQSAASSIMSRSRSFDIASPTTQVVAQHLQSQREASNVDSAQLEEPSSAMRSTSPHGALCTSSSTRHALRRSQSAKRGSSKIASMEQAMKSASIKSNKEAILASHQHQHQQQQHVHQTQQSQSAAALASTWDWEQSSTSGHADDLTDMDLDQMGEILNAQLGNTTSNASSVSAPPSSNSHDQANALRVVSTPSNGAHGSASNTLLANLYQGLGLENQTSHPQSNRTVAVDSFQDLLDPLAPLQVSAPQWGDLSSTSLSPWVPVSSAAAAPQTIISTPSSTAQRRDHEHNEWAGDLLHRGSFASLVGGWNAQDFINAINLQGSSATEPDPRSAQRATQYQEGLEQQSRQQGQREPVGPSPSAFDRSMSTSFLPGQRPSIGQDHSYSVPSVHDFISRTTRRLSNPPRPLGSTVDLSGSGSDSMFQSAYRMPYPYPADDMFLSNPSLAGSMTLFPSLINGATAHPAGSSGEGGESDPSASSVHRRKSTDTLRENTLLVSAVPDGREGNPMGGSLLSERQTEEPSSMNETSSDCAHQSGDVTHLDPSQSRSVSSLDVLGASADENDDNMPSRAASLGGVDLVNVRDHEGLYAESLPDLSTGGGFGGVEHTGTSSSDSSFPQVQHLQMSFDDLDLPSFFNRSPSFAFANPVVSSSTTFNSPRMTSSSNDGAWLRLLATRGGWREGGEGGLPQNNNIPIDEQLSPGSIQSQARSATGATGAGTNLSTTMTSASSNHASMSNSLFSGVLKDAGALDRLEHLYLEGLHTPASPIMAQFSQQPGGQASSSQGFSSNLPRFAPFGHGHPTNEDTFSIDRTGALLESGNGYESA